MNFFWGLWTQGGSNRFDIGEIEDVWANTPGEKNGVYCVPKTTLASPYGPTPEDGYESGCTCKDKNWTWKTASTHTEIRYNGFGYITVIVPDRSVRAKGHDRGKGYWAVLKTVQDNFSFDKILQFDNTARNSKVIY